MRMSSGVSGCRGFREPGYTDRVSRESEGLNLRAAGDRQGLTEGVLLPLVVNEDQLCCPGLGCGPENASCLLTLRGFDGLGDRARFQVTPLVVRFTGNLTVHGTAAIVIEVGPLVGKVIPGRGVSEPSGFIANSETPPGVVPLPWFVT
jgi:hypothetical protein